MARPTTNKAKKGTGRKGKRRVPPANLSRISYLQSALKQYEELAIAAEHAESWGPAKDAKKEAVVMRAEIDRLREQEVQCRIPASPKAHWEELILAVRRLRLEAPAYVAKGLILAEAELLRDAEARVRQDAADAHASRTTEDLEAEAERLRAERTPGAPALTLVKR